MCVQDEVMVRYMCFLVAIYSQSFAIYRTNSFDVPLDEAALVLVGWLDRKTMRDELLASSDSPVRVTNELAREQDHIRLPLLQVRLGDFGVVDVAYSSHDEARVCLLDDLGVRDLVVEVSCYFSVSTRK